MFKPAYLSLMMGLLFTSAVLAQSIDVAEPYPIQEANLNLTEANEGGAFELKRAGDQLVVVLEGNPTTGYTWAVEAMDENILQQVDDADFFPDSDAIGAGGKLVLHFRAMAMGQTALRLVYHRPWEEDVEPLKTFEVNITVQTHESDEHPIQDADIALTEADEGSMVALSQVDAVLEIVLDANPTTGHMWAVEALDESILQQAGAPEFLSDSNVPGSGGKLTLRFHAMATGQTTLRLVYHRPWEEDVEPLKTFAVNIMVRSGEVPAEDSMSYEEWLDHYGDDLNDDGLADEADYELWKENPYIGIPTPTAVSTQSWGTIKKAMSR